MKRWPFLLAALALIGGVASAPGLRRAPEPDAPAAPPPPLRYMLQALGSAEDCTPVPRDGCKVVLSLSGGSVRARTPQLSAAALAAQALENLPKDEGIRLLVSLPQQKVYVFSDGDLLATSPVSTGKPGHGTPVGRFRITEKKVRHRSNTYSNAPMPYMQRITRYGVALHAGRLPGYPASHGCIRLPWGFAQTLYEVTDMGTIVTITRARPKSATEALNLT